MEKKKTTAAWIGLAATWFGMHCGSGFATGTQYTIYYNKFGRMAMFLPLITWALLAVSMYFFFEYGREKKISSYADYVKNLFDFDVPWLKWLPVVLIIAFDVWCVFGQILGDAGILAGSGSLYQNYGINYWVGVIVTAVIILGMVCFGKNILAKVNSYMMYVLIAVILIISVVGLVANFDNFKTVMATPALTEENGLTFIDALKSAFTYAGVQISSIMALSGLVAGLSSRKEAAKAAIGGGLINVVMLMALGLVMIANYPAINSETLPVYAAVDALGIPVMKHLYSLMLYLALITTGAGCTFAIVNRFKQYPMKWFKWSEQIASVVIACILLGIGAFASKFGLVAIFSKGYSYLAKMSWPLGFAPLLILVPIRMHYMKKTEKTAEG